MDRLPQGAVFSIIINIYTKMRHLLARKSQLSQKLSGTKQKIWGESLLCPTKVDGLEELMALSGFRDRGNIVI